jgi:hypothetical protein
MPKRFLILLAGTAAIVYFGSGLAGADDVDGKRDATSVEQFVDGSWVLQIDRAWSGHRGLRTPSAQLPEANYHPLPNGPSYPIVVSDGGSRVEIGETRRSAVHHPVKGSRSSSGEPIVYDLQDGTFAGGRLAVWSSKQGLQAELTIYGSGVPIISSERGVISKKH